MQRYESVEQEIREKFLELKRTNPEAVERKLDLSWSNWGFGLEELNASCDRLSRAGLSYIELHGNHYGESLGYDALETKQILADFGLEVSGVCGMYGDDNDFSSNRPIQQQAAIDYTKRELDFCAEVGADYLLVVPGAVGRPDAYDSSERMRSLDALRRVGTQFEETGVKGAIEPIRSAEVSFVHTVQDATEYIEALDMPGVQWINGDVYHMQSEESNIAEAIVDAGWRLVNLHMADSNRRGIGKGSMNMDVIIMALYLVGQNQPGRYVTPEPLGPGAGPYAARTKIQDPEKLDQLVLGSIDYFRAREDVVRSL